MNKTSEIGFGGGCHWCTEAVFQSLKGVVRVDQGYISSVGDAASFSEAVTVEYDAEMISLKTLIEIHLYTHNSTSNHSFREKYRSAVYFIAPEDEKRSARILEELQKEFREKLVTQVLKLGGFKASRESLQDYYLKNPEKPFCQKYIDPKLELFQKKFQKERKKWHFWNPSLIEF